MKNLIFTLALFIAGSTLYAQSGDEILFHAKVKKEDVPGVIIESVEDDFPGYSIVQTYGTPVEIVEDNWYIDVDKPITGGKYDTYTLKISDKQGEIVALYDAQGNLISEHGKLKNVALPAHIQKAIGQHFPNWVVAQDKVIMTAHRDGQKKVHYKVKLEKGGKSFKAVFDANGNLLKGKQYASHKK